MHPVGAIRLVDFTAWQACKGRLRRRSAASRAKFLPAQDAAAILHPWCQTAEERHAAIQALM
eukprot:9501301-Alexandrium_andersonii.AAC.1